MLKEQGFDAVFEFKRMREQMSEQLLWDRFVFRSLQFVVAGNDWNTNFR